MCVCSPDGLPGPVGVASEERALDGTTPPAIFSFLLYCEEEEEAMAEKEVHFRYLLSALKNCECITEHKTLIHSQHSYSYKLYCMCYVKHKMKSAKLL